MEFKNELYKCSFTLPDRPTVRQQLTYYSQASGDTLFRFWLGAKSIITNWKCEILPDMDADLDTLTDPTQTALIIWVGVEVSKFVSALDDIPKN